MDVQGRNVFVLSVPELLSGMQAGWKAKDKVEADELGSKNVGNNGRLSRIQTPML